MPHNKVFIGQDSYIASNIPKKLMNLGSSKISCLFKYQNTTPLKTIPFILESLIFTKLLNTNFLRCTIPIRLDTILYLFRIFICIA